MTTRLYGGPYDARDLANRPRSSRCGCPTTRSTGGFSLSLRTQVVTIDVSEALMLASSIEDASSYVHRRNVDHGMTFDDDGDPL